MNGMNKLSMLKVFVGIMEVVDISEFGMTFAHPGPLLPASTCCGCRRHSWDGIYHS